MSEPLVSVTIPAYNHEKYVREAINSIIAQSYKRIELLVLDDGSKDGTWDIIQSMRGECEARFERVWFGTQPNQGTRKTNNRLLQEARGEYVYLIASDDRALPDAIRQEVEFLEGHPDYALVTGDNAFIDSEGKRCYWAKDKSCVYTKSAARWKTFGEALGVLRMPEDTFGSYKRLLMGNHIPNGYLIRKSVFEKTGFYREEAPLEDYWLMLQISKYARIKFIPEPLFEYRWHGANTASNDAKMHRMTVSTLKYECGLMRQADISGYLPQVQSMVQGIRSGEELELRRGRCIPVVAEWIYALRFPSLTWRHAVRLLGVTIPLSGYRDMG